MRQTLDLNRPYASGQFLPIIGREIRGEELLISVLGNRSKWLSNNSCQSFSFRVCIPCSIRI